MADENETQTVSETPTLAELDERLTALENASKYTLRYSGEQIDALLDLISERGFESGRETVTVGRYLLYKLVYLPISGATDGTRVLVTVRGPAFANPYANICVTLGQNGNRIYATLTMGPNVAGASSSVYLPAGDYYIDWLVIGR